MTIKLIYGLLKLIDSDSELIQIAKGKYEYTGNIFRDAKKILRNEKGNN